jgi:methylthioribose-1-phosphate isomerase
MAFLPLKFKKNHLQLLDQRLLPLKEVWMTCQTSKDVHKAIRTMIVRGAPAIGISAGYGLFLGVRNFKGRRPAFLKKLKQEAEFLKTARPTAVNLRNVIDEIDTAIEISGEQEIRD